VLEARRERGDRERGCIGRQDRVGRHDDLELAEQFALGIEVLDDRLDHELRGDDVADGVHCADSLACSVCLARIELALRDQRAERVDDPSLGLLGGVDARIEELNAVPSLRCDLCDAGAHGARTEHGNRRFARKCTHFNAP
jgi:hypothetical protein